MIKKEFKDIIQSVFVRLFTGILLILLLFVLLRLLGEKHISFFSELIRCYKMFFWIIIVWISYNLGINMFKKEYNDHAIEYLLSSPQTKAGILTAKFIPRLIFLMLFSSFYIVVDASSLILITIFTTFFCSAFLSIYRWGNYKATVWMIFYIPVFALNLLLHHFLEMNTVSGDGTVMLSRDSLSLSFTIITVILGIGFLYVYKKMDIRPINMFKNKLALISIAPLVAIIILSILVKLGMVH